MAGFGAFLAAILVAPVSAGLRRQEPLSPALKPEDHDKFFDHDYPDDKRPAATKAFDFQHPFPVVQDSEDYDKDYVKDENTDGGEWRAQEKYDLLRNKLQGSNSAMEKAKAAEEAEASKLADLKKAEKAAEAAEAAAKSKSDEASSRKVSADAALKGAGISAAEAEVFKETKDLEDCKKKLEEARAELRRQMAERDEALKNLPTSNKPIEEIKSDVQRLEHAVAMAASRLRSYRHSSVDSDGGVYYMTTAPPKYYPPPPAPAPAPRPPAPPAPKSGAYSSRVALGAIVAAAATVMFGLPA